MIAINKIKISCDYFTVAFICIAVILCHDSRYITAVLCTVLHELGHIAVMLFYGCEKIDIKINLFNIAIADEMRGIRSYRQDAAVICAGPIVNLALFIVFGFVYMMYKYEFFYNISIISGVLCIFNMLPIESTDGGQLLEIVLKKRFSPYNVQIVMNVLTIIFIVPLACLGFYVLFQTRYNYTLLFAAMYFCFVIVMNYK